MNNHIQLIRFTIVFALCWVGKCFAIRLSCLAVCFFLFPPHFPCFDFLFDFVITHFCLHSRFLSPSPTPHLGALDRVFFICVLSLTIIPQFLSPLSVLFVAIWLMHTDRVPVFLHSHSHSPVRFQPWLFYDIAFLLHFFLFWKPLLTASPHPNPCLD